MTETWLKLATLATFLLRRVFMVAILRTLQYTIGRNLVVTVKDFALKW